jgi:hypothetical protein
MDSSERNNDNFYCTQLPSPPSSQIDNIANNDGILGVEIGTMLMLAMIAITLQQTSNKLINLFHERDNRLDDKIEAINDRIDVIIRQINFFE